VFSFEEFRTALRRGTLPESELGRYVELDPTSARVKLRLKPNALRGHVSPGFDVDAEVQRYQRMVCARARQDKLRTKEPLARVVAEGDSWFNLPWIIRPPAIGDQLEDHPDLDLKNIAMWGDTLADIVARSEYLNAIDEVGANWFLLSAGGNDLQEALARGHLLTVFDPEKTPDQSILDVGKMLLVHLAEQTRVLIAGVSAAFPAVKIACHGYDFPRPEVGKGKYIGKYMAALGYPENKRKAVVEALINRYYAELGSKLNGLPNVQLLDFRGATRGLSWFDDMHPQRDGFAVMAQRFVKVILPGKRPRAVATRGGAVNRRRGHK